MELNLQFGLTIIGILLTFILFYHIKTLNGKKMPKNIRLSIIIPARNEAINLKTLLESLLKQSVKIHEIIVVNDASEDETSALARTFPVKVIDLFHKPEGFAGKTYACLTGAKAATGSLLLFLDADLKLAPDAVEKLLCQHRPQTVLSVAPFHHTQKLYEQLSLFFNAISVAAVGMCLPGKDKSIGLFGPVLLLERALYFEFGGHELVKNEVLEDFILGTRLRARGIPCDLFLGGRTISYQMYKGGLSDLIWGWSKNIASGALKTPPLYLLLSVLWLSAYYTAAIELIKSGLLFLGGAVSLEFFLLYVALYFFAALILYIKVRKIGSFPFISCIFYLFPLFGFTLIFIFSLVLKLVLRRVKWKGRWQNI